MSDPHGYAVYPDIPRRRGLELGQWAAHVGRCGDHAPAIFPTSPPQVCALPAGHDGWHRSDEGTEWTAGAVPGCRGCADLEARLRIAEKERDELRLSLTELKLRRRRWWNR